MNNKTWQVINGNSAEVLKQYPDNHFDSVVCDPPYLIGFLGKEWDDQNNDLTNVFRECIRVLKPGGHLLAFSAARTYHKIATMIENVGFEIRDQIMWVYGSGFPKSQDVGKAIDKRGGKHDSNTSLEEAKSILKNLFDASKKTISQINKECGFNAGGYLITEGKNRSWANNLPLNEKWEKIKSVINCDNTYDYLFTSMERPIVGNKSSGCYNSSIDHYTIGSPKSSIVPITAPASNSANQWHGWGTNLKPAHEPIVMARKPIPTTIIDNVQEWGVGALNIDACRVEYANEADKNSITHNVLGSWSGHTHNQHTYTSGDYQKTETNELGRFPANFIHDGSDEVIQPLGEAQRFFYCAKVSRSERMSDNNHPTVKPVALMKYLIQLVTPPNGHVLDPFNGSGSTGMAAVELGMEYTGIELDPNYVAIANKRIQAWYDKCNPVTEDKPDLLLETGLFEYQE